MITVAIDLDECLFPCIRSLDKYMNRQYGIKPDPKCTSYHFSQRYHVPSHHMKHIVRDFYTSRECLTSQPIKGSVQSLSRLKQRYRLICVTGRQTYSKRSTHLFLDEHFPHVFDKVIYTNSYSLHGKSISKRVVCKREKASVFVDDNEMYINECKDLTLTFAFLGSPHYSWAYEGNDTPVFEEWDKFPLLNRV